MKKRGVILVVLFFILFVYLFFYFIVAAVTIETVESTNDIGWYSSIALDSNGKAHISYYDDTNDDLRYCNNTAGSWSCVAIDTAGGVGSDTSIAIDSNNKVHISYRNATNHDLKYCNNTASDGSWSCTTIDASADIMGVRTSIAIDTNNKAHVSHYDSTNDDLRYCNNTAGSWSCVAVDTAGSVGDYSSIAIDSNNKVHISYYNITGSDLKYCNNTASDGSWSCTVVQTSGSVGRETSIAIDSNNKVHISHRGSNLIYCNNTASDGSWSCTGADTDPSTGLQSSIAIDSNNKVHISSMYGVNPYDLRYCNNTAGSWSCTTLTYADAWSLGWPNGRALAIKKGRIVDSTSFSDYAHMSWYNDTELMYTTIGIASHNFSISLNQPSNNTNISDSTPNINFTVSGTASSYRCTVYFNSVDKGSNAFTLNNTLTTITASTLSDGSYLWYVNCTAGLTINQSEIRNIIIDTVTPTITSFTCSPSSVTAGGTVTCACSGTDATSGISSTSYTANPSTSSTGTFTLTCTITDYAGNSASTTTTYTVISGGAAPSQPTQSQTFTQITPEQPATMTITNPNLDLTEIKINVEETVYSASLTVTKVDVSQADLGIGLPTGKVYQAFEINATKLNETNLTNVTIEFKINKTWLEEQNGISNDIRLYRKTKNVWNPWQALNTTLIEEDSNFYYFSAISSGFSTFMIFFGKYECNVGEKRCFNDQVQLCLGNYTWMVTEKCKFGCEDDKCVSPTPALKFGSAMFYIVVGLVGGVIIAVIYFIYKRIRRKRLGV